MSVGGAADGRAAGGGEGAADGAADDGLGGAVAVEHPDGSGPPFDDLGGYGLAGADEAQVGGEGGALGQGAEDDGRQRDEVDAPVVDEVDERPSGSAALLVGDDEGAAGQQRQHDPEDGRVEAERRELQDAGVGVEFEPVAEAADHVQEPVVGHDDALGAAGGAGGVDDVRRVAGQQRGRAVGVGEVGGGPRGEAVGGLRGVEEQDVGVTGVGQALGAGGGRGVGDEDGGARVLEHVRDPVGRVLGVDRQVGRARLERGEGGDDDVRGARQHHGDGLLGADAVVGEEPGQPVGAGVEVGVRDLLVAEDDGRLGGGLGGPRLEDVAGQAGTHGPGAGAAGPVGEDLAQLVLAERVEAAEGGAGGGGELFEDAGEAADEGGGLGGGEDVRPILGLQAHPVALDGEHAERQRVLGDDAGAPGAGGEAGDVVAEGVEGARGVVVEADHGVEELADARALLHLGEAEVLVRGEGELAVLEVGEHRLEGQGRVEGDAHRQGVHEGADDALDVGQVGGAPGGDGAEGDVAPSGEPAEGDGPAALHDGVQRQAALVGPGGDGGGELLGQVGGEGLGQHRHAGAVGGAEAGGFVEAGEVLLPGLAGGVGVLGGGPLQVGADGGDGGQGGGVGAVAPQGDQFTGEDGGQGPAVDEQVVGGPHDAVPAAGGAVDGEAGQRALGDVEAAQPLLVGEAGQFGVDAAGVEVGEVDLLPRHLDGAGDELHGVARVAVAEAGAQRRVAGDERGGGGAQRGRVEGAVHVEDDLEGVGVHAVPVELGLEQQAALER
ncbi:hypothetical protein GCM10018785_33150 [Streptomyces longispororuber]|uniref:Uncharacterized protein n=1 Tax=Streptomyces longispororuber TaxID=68230 RepID=A0A918ZP63_9ACTN|nr:hypothetical protein GCM10018785_33150 [Streptomyces longispororuber]